MKSFIKNLWDTILDSIRFGCSFRRSFPNNALFEIAVRENNEALNFKKKAFYLNCEQQTVFGGICA